MPGGPKTSVTDPPTTPPPRTRSSSLTPVDRGRAASLDTSRSATADVTTAPAAPAPGRVTRTGAGPNVFHSAHCAHRPTQRREVVPHTAQT